MTQGEPPAHPVSGADLSGRTVDGYRIESLLGRGGMGEVYKAYDTNLERHVALKIVSAADALDRELALRFEREAKSASGLSHPHLAHIYATGRLGSRPYYVMEYIEGRSLADILVKEGRIGGPRGLSYLAQACEGLAAAHAQGLIHRDLKPDNLMIDARDVLKIVDFGLARKVDQDSSLTTSGMVVGTPRYMAPEQALGQRVDQRSDIYALGATFYHLFTGGAPFDAPTPVALMMKHVQEPLVPLKNRQTQIPQPVCRIVERMLAKEPGQRYQSYEELLSDIGSVRSGSARMIAEPTRAIASAPPQAREPGDPEPRAGLSPVVGGTLFLLVLAVAFLAFRSSRLQDQVGRMADRGTPATGAAPRERPASREKTSDESPARTSAPYSGEPDTVRTPASPASPTAAPGVYPGMDPARMIGMAYAAKTVANMRNISTALMSYRAEHEDVPSSLDGFGERYELQPSQLRDGWGGEIRYERSAPQRFRLTSAGLDRSFGTKDDIVIENGLVVSGEMELPIGPAGRK